VLSLGVIQAVSGAVRHQLAVTNWLRATYRSIQLVGRHLSTAGTAVTNEIQPGDIVGTVSMDAMRIGGAFDVIPRFIGALVSWLVVSIILLSTSAKLGLIVLIGVPILTSATRPLMKPLHERQRAQRDVSGKLAALGSDTVAGLRILRGIGGEDVFLDNYITQSRSVERSGIEVSKPQSALESGQILLPAILTAVITYFGAHEVINGNLQAGQLVAFFGYATFLTMPLRTAIEYVIAGTRALVGARKVIGILNIPPVVSDEPGLAWPSSIERFSDRRTGICLARGTLAALVTETPAEATEVTDRLGWFTTDVDDVTLDAIPITSYAIGDVRRHIVVSEIEPHLFTGLLRSELNPHETASEGDIMGAISSASAQDVLDALADGLDSTVEERGRSFSGGQRQRLALTRALLTEADLLILVEPTSAVDTHTEGRIARNMREAREGRTTLIATTSPLLLEKVDEVIALRDGVVAARGSHKELLNHHGWYRTLILRGDE
jgi:ABC-type multidrug transport system fused ATPase/permease subunit